MFGLELNSNLIWTVLAILFFIVEGLTLGLTTIWFALGSLAALVVSLLGFGVAPQLVAFLLVGILTLLFTRPAAKKLLRVGMTKTNVDSLVGKPGIVHIAIEPHAVGQVKVNGQIWSAKGENEDIRLSVGEEIVVLSIDGVKLIVAAKKLKEE